MIGVLADDLSGAAEVGGVALRYGLSAEVQTELTPSPAGVICLDTATRICPPVQAAARVSRAGVAMRKEGRHLFKKVDSVLRGPVAAEISALLIAEQPRALLAPANPSRGRTLRNGYYYVDGQPLASSEFARDPDHPARASSVADLLGWPLPLPLAILAPGARLPESGLIVGQATDSADLKHWAGRVGSDVLPAGAAEFFAAWLEAQGHAPHITADPEWRRRRGGRHLFVSGTTASAGQAFVARCQAHGWPVLAPPPGLFAPAGPIAGALAQWSVSVAEALDHRLMAIMTIGGPLRREADWPARLNDYLARAAAGALARQPVDYLWVEGGATAQALLRRLGWRRLTVTAEIEPGVVALAPAGPGPEVIVKPGSYAWPVELVEPLSPSGGRP